MKIGSISSKPFVMVYAKWLELIYRKLYFSCLLTKKDNKIFIEFQLFDTSSVTQVQG